MFAIRLFQLRISARNVAPVFPAWRGCKGVALRYNRHSGLSLLYAPHLIQHYTLCAPRLAPRTSHWAIRALQCTLHAPNFTFWAPRSTSPHPALHTSRFKAGSVLHKLRSALKTSHSLYSTLRISHFNIPCFTRNTPDFTFHTSNFAPDAQRFAPRMPHCAVYTRALYLTPVLHSAF